VEGYRLTLQRWMRWEGFYETSQSKLKSREEEVRFYCQQHYGAGSVRFRAESFVLIQIGEQ
jgi:hypothetical protein